MSTQLISARNKKITPEMEQVALDEGLAPEEVRRLVEEGVAVIPINNRRKFRPIGIGRNMRTKTNANLGTSADELSIEDELLKLKAAVEAGADTVMDLSTGGDLRSIRREIVKNAGVPVGTVPIYQAACENMADEKRLEDITADDLFRVIEQHGEEGVDFITVHCGVTREVIARVEREGRLLDVVSRGGALLSKWMKYNKRENPLYEQYDRLIEIARTYDMTLSLGDGLRPGCLADATDRGQVQETIILGELAQRAREAGVQVMIEGPGHMPMDQIETNIILMKRLTHNVPFYVLGPLVTDIAAGYDHITAAIGGAIAARAGADYLCVVTPAEHLRLPTVEDIREGVIAARIAAHAADIGKGIKGAMEKDNKMARARKTFDWDYQIRNCINPAHAAQVRASSKPEDDSVCTMCSALCAYKHGGVGEGNGNGSH
ncbi:MAG: phosphomethylpyrimidine synthase ThiC [Nitrospinae bacterium]|nr:phosphomethylpyrimidine synthase ThiC [Nitrospinota bacterium]